MTEIRITYISRELRDYLEDQARARNLTYGGKPSLSRTILKLLREMHDAAKKPSNI